MGLFAGLFLGLFLAPFAWGAQVGAAVSWVAYDNRQDFISDRRLLRQVIEQPRGLSIFEPQGFFNIPAHRHFEVAVDANVSVGPERPSFEAALDKAIASLENLDFQKDEAFLLVAIASHGDEGWMGRGYGPVVSLDQLAILILQKRREFESRTGRRLRLEILYSACHSGSLIQAFQRNMNEPKDIQGSGSW
jgi:hypothetical protein